MYDVIGDIHGHADELEALLQRLGYVRSPDGYRHPSRQGVFVGDFIDRGPKIVCTREVVRAMVESGAAGAVLGNHELNALAYHTRGPDGKHLRPHNEKNTHQHQATLAQLSDAQLEQALTWFRTLPLWLELEGLRVVHACWDPAGI